MNILTGWIYGLLGVAAISGAEVASRYWQPELDDVENGRYESVLHYQIPDADTISIQALPIEPSQVGYLTHDRGRRFAFFDRSGSRGMELLYLEYDGNNSRFFFDLFNHPPERCMASTGAEVTERHPNEIVELDGSDGLLQRLEVVDHETKERRFIFKLTWVHPDHPLEYGASIHLKRMQAALATIPPPPARLLMAGLYGFDSEQEASAFFERYVTSQLQFFRL